MQSAQAIIGEIYDAWRAQDLEWLASYLPDDFCHTIYIPQGAHPWGGECRGKAATVARLGVIADDFEFLEFDTSGLIVHDNRGAVEIPARFRHRETGASLDTTIVNIWTFEDGWPVRLSEYHDVELIEAFNKYLSIFPGMQEPQG